MSKIVLIFMVFLLLLAEAPVALADAAIGTTATTEAFGVPVPRPNFRKYRGNSRHKPHKLGVFKRWSLRRKAARKRKNRSTPSIKVGAPVRTKK